MKRSLIAVAVTGLLFVANAGAQESQSPTKRRFESAPVQVAAVSIPDWFLEPPENSKDNIFSVGEATGPFLGMTVQKAMLDADAKLAYQMKSTLDSNIKSFKTDTGGKFGAESSEMLVKKYTSAVISGHKKVSSQITQEGSNFRVFVLMSYPMGETNPFVKNETGNDIPKDLSARVANADRELQSNLGRDVPPKETVVVKPVPADTVKATPIEPKAEAPKAAGPVEPVEPLTESQIELRENSAVKPDLKPVSQVNPNTLLGPTISDPAVREQVLQAYKKPGAVVMQSTVQ